MKNCRAKMGTQNYKSRAGVEGKGKLNGAAEICRYSYEELGNKKDRLEVEYAIAS